MAKQEKIEFTADTAGFLAKVADDYEAVPGEVEVRTMAYDTWTSVVLLPYEALALRDWLNRVLKEVV